ncbi:hypothetical protein [Chitinophaga arvensicola]|uniref:Uncharacterized protein n=1 Tax=Chitinophaga arvensicola TaxID=29529 RepID=A0A1I0S9N3_9BACT|nr:hypothetical protein [Chitinophaga arvensicola]SEW52877.1 hypothetical protein SAMN04488122_5203 [Chitinophaga arvensicola]
MKAIQLFVTIIFFSYAAIAQNKLESTGNVGIGTLQPQSALQIGNYSTNNQSKITIPGTYNFERLSLGQEGNGNAAIEFVHHRTDSISYGVKMGTAVDAFGPGFYITTAPESYAYATLAYKTSPAIFINTANSVGIGTKPPAGYKLAVAGDFLAEKVKVKLQSGWPDYVFDVSYPLPSLQQVEDFIRTYKHLPQIPSAKEVADKGLDIASNQAALLQKIEELTLYLIEQDKLIKEQQQLLKDQDRRLQQLERNK